MLIIVALLGGLLVGLLLGRWLSYREGYAAGRERTLARLREG